MKVRVLGKTEFDGEPFVPSRQWLWLIDRELVSVCIAEHKETGRLLARVVDGGSFDDGPFVDLQDAISSRIAAGHFVSAAEVNKTEFEMNKSAENAEVVSGDMNKTEDRPQRVPDPELGSHAGDALPYLEVRASTSDLNRLVRLQDQAVGKGGDLRDTPALRLRLLEICGGDVDFASAALQFVLGDHEQSVGRPPGM